MERAYILERGEVEQKDIYIYMRKKEEAKEGVGMALHVYNEIVMKEICEG